MKNQNQNPANPSLSRQQEEILARQIAKDLNDQKNTGFYLTLIQKFPLKILNDLYYYAKEYPEVNTKANKDLLFNYLVRQYQPAQGKTQNKQQTGKKHRRWEKVIEEEENYLNQKI